MGFYEQKKIVSVTAATNKACLVLAERFLTVYKEKYGEVWDGDGDGDMCDLSKVLLVGNKSR